MKKKYLRSLSSLEKWLVEQGVEVAPLKEALDKIREALKSLPDAKEDNSLPIPAELTGEIGTIALYTDGGCRGNPGPGAYGFVAQSADGTVLAEGVGYDAMTTNNKMELSGPIHGLKELAQILPAKNIDPMLTKIKVITDSKYVVEGMKSWLSGWKARGWRKADNKTPENLEIWQELDQCQSKFMLIEWVWVKGHAGHPQNEYCDRKANELMDKHLS